jgi:DNA-binding NarL/FixJ family response regulator
MDGNEVMLDQAAQSLRILIVDDHPFVREGLSARLSLVPQLDVVGEAGDADAALRCLDALSPDIVLCDIGMRGTNGLELTALMLRKQPGLKVLMLSMFDKPEFVREALEVGARGYIVKDSTSEQIICAIDSVAAGGTYLSPGLASSLFHNGKCEDLLSQREEEVLRLLAKGHSSKVIARALDISVRTVDSHRQSIKRKLCIDGQAELVKYAVERFHM